MKYLYLLFFFIIINQAYAQKYKPLVEEGKYWIYNHHAYSECLQLWQIGIEIRYFSGDTTIDGRSYKKLVSSSVPLSVPPYEITSKRSLCYMREDTMQRKVFMVNYDENVFPCADGKEVCIWDFGLNVGDTIKNCTYDILYPLDFGELTHNVIDTIINLPSVYGFDQKHFYTIGVSPGQCNDPWIYPISYAEGFGMEDGPIIKRFGSYLSKYCEGTLEQCNIVSSTKNTSDTPSNKIKIFPNPTSDYMTYLIPTNHNNIINQYCIKDISGQIVKSSEHPLQSEASNIINTHDFPSGLYFIQFLKDGQIVQSEKFIITN